MSEKLFGSEDIIKLFKKLEKRIDKLECFIKECCSKIPINIGNGVGIYKRLFDHKWEFKSLVAGNNVTITDNTYDITISADGGTIAGDPNEILYFDSSGNITSDSNAVRSDVDQQTRISREFDADLEGGFTLTDNSLILSSPFIGHYLNDTNNNVSAFNGIIGDTPLTTINGVFNTATGDLTYSEHLTTGINEMKYILGVSNMSFNNTSSGLTMSPYGTEWGFISTDNFKYFINPTSIGWNANGTPFSLPPTDGSSGDVMTTDGAGNITFQPVSGSGFTCTDLNSCSTTNLPEGTNLYYTQARFNSAFSAKSTSDLSEGTNLYFTNSRAITALTGQNISLFTNDSGYITSSALSPYLTIASAALTYYPLTNPSGYTSNTGTVTTLSVATANGFSGTVSNPSTTPEITIDASGLDVSKLADGTVSNTEFQYINSLTSNAQTQLDAKTFSVPFLSNALDPLDATNYFFGGISNLIPPSTTNTNQDFVIGYACTVVGCVIQAHGNTTQGSSEDVALRLRNNTANTTTTMGNFKTNATSTTTVVTSITGLNISVAASDLITLQMNGTWATNPTQVRLTGYLIIRL